MRTADIGDDVISSLEKKLAVILGKLLAMVSVDYSAPCDDLRISIAYVSSGKNIYMK